jgi:hypothetical protein
MWTIERCEEKPGTARATRWVKVPGVSLATRQEAAQAARDAVRRELADGVQYRTHRYRVAALAMACLVLQ